MKNQVWSARMYNNFNAAISFLLFGNKLPWERRKQLANKFREKSREYAKRRTIMYITDDGFKRLMQLVHKEEAELEK